MMSINLLFFFALPRNKTRAYFLIPVAMLYSLFSFVWTSGNNLASSKKRRLLLTEVKRLLYDDTFAVVRASAVQSLDLGSIL